MQECHSEVRDDNTGRIDAALERLRTFLVARREAAPAVGDLEVFERELHAQVVEVEREMLASELARLDVDVPTVVIAGSEYRRVVRCEQTDTSAAGPIRVERTLYRTRTGEQALCPMELRAGIIEGQWTPLAASCSG
jgi:adenine-specific DNA methylase